MESTTVLCFLFFFIIHTITASPPPLLPKQALPTKSGYLPVNPTTTSAIFYTFYEAQNPTSPLSQTPLLIWLQGGPGCSSMVGNFFELGPWRVNFHKHPSDPLTLEPNSGSWNRIFGLVFLDNPIGTGFSIASTPEEIPRNQFAVAQHLFAAITEFIELDPVFRSRPVYITGESYAGKYIPAIGYYILQRNIDAESSGSDRHVNLAGVAIGNGETDPVIQVKTHAVNAYFSGLINERQKREVEELQFEAVDFSRAGKWSEAKIARSRVLDRLQDMTGLPTLYDIRRNASYETHLVGELLRNEEVRKALGVSNESIVFEECSHLVGEVLHEDMMKSVKYMVEELVRKSKVLLYQGQFDMRCGVVANEAWVKTMKWEGIERFLSADRRVWRLGGEVAGYVQKWGSLSFVLVSGAGHLVPADQPLRAQAMIEDWVLGKGLFANVEEHNLSSI
ncbi:serine carboxypeptidase-like 50 [Rosa rugosa]|uniref:serine carboxypeptidase-like 50 n=1 Tax=Rosa rugosa TaxID=74645 RepID=UPI002B40FB8E|nr:serine carboxypeptidase-like 50 [Rosa rugosa]